MFNFKKHNSQGNNENTGNAADSQAESLNEVFILMGLICHIDESINPYETHIATQYATCVLHLDNDRLDKGMHSFYNASTLCTSHTQAAKRVYKKFKKDTAFLLDLYDWLERLSLCDGQLCPAEQQALKKIHKEFRLKKNILDKSDDPYFLLGCDSQASIDEIKKAYRHKIAQYHPDTIMAISPPEEFIQHTMGRFQAIKAAYENIRKRRRF